MPSFWDTVPSRLHYLHVWILLQEMLIVSKDKNNYTCSYLSLTSYLHSLYSRGCCIRATDASYAVLVVKLIRKHTCYCMIPFYDKGNDRQASIYCIIINIHKALSSEARRGWIIWACMVLRNKKPAAA